MTTTAATELDGKGVEAATIAEAFRRKFHLVRGDRLPGGDELTPTMKLKRKPIAAKYESEIEAMYAE